MGGQWSVVGSQESVGGGRWTEDGLAWTYPCREVDVARYDTAHGKPHLDLLSASGTLKAKRWLDVDNFEQALTLAIEDFKLNYEEYLGSH